MGVKGRVVVVLEGMLVKKEDGVGGVAGIGSFNVLDWEMADGKRGDFCRGYKFEDCTAGSSTNFNFANCVNSNDEKVLFLCERCWMPRVGVALGKHVHLHMNVKCTAGKACVWEMDRA